MPVLSTEPVNRIRLIREALLRKHPYAFTIEEVARRIGVSSLTLRNWEHGRYRPQSRRTAERLARDLGVTVEELGLEERAVTVAHGAGDVAEAARPSVAVAIVTDQAGRCLMTRRRFREGTLEWSAPSGECEPGETAEEAAVREVREEIGLDVEAVRRLGDRVHPATGRHLVYVACRVVAGAASLVDHEELAELEWDTLPQVLERLHGLKGGLFDPVRAYLAGIPVEP